MIILEVYVKFLKTRLTIFHLLKSSFRLHKFLTNNTIKNPHKHFLRPHFRMKLDWITSNSLGNFKPLKLNCIEDIIFYMIIFLQIMHLLYCKNLIGKRTCRSLDKSKGNCNTFIFMQSLKINLIGCLCFASITH